MKYIDADKLISEIERKRDSALERQKNLEKIGQETVLNEMIAFELNRLISFIASLQQEQPEVNINKEIDDLWKSLNTGHDYVIVDSYQDFLGICLHCFELGLNARKEE